MGRHSHLRTIRFADTDAAGVVYFARYYMIAHEAYEAALESLGITLAQFFSEQELVIPISKSEASYLRPLQCGDKIRIDLTSHRLSDDSFAVDYQILKLAPSEKRAAVLRTEHVCVSTVTRKRQPLPTPLVTWLEG
jgi:1,4-dihydroxy-2-naphthoyl-CoA hydrolase